MVNVDDAFQVTYKSSGETFQVLVDFDELKKFKANPNEISVYDVLADQKVFRDQKKGDLVSDNLLKEVFKDKSEEEIFKEIVLKGECQIPTSYINKQRDEKKMQVVNYIAENSVNPSTKAKYTTSMIESEVGKLNYNFNPNLDFKKQAEEVLSELKKAMPIAIVKSTIKMKIPGKDAGAFYGPFRNYGTVSKEFYDEHGNLQIQMEVNTSIVDEVISFIKSKTSGQGEYVVEND